SITSSLKKIILQESKRNPHLGVRGLSKILKEKHKFNVSKSAINNILKAKGIKGKKGRKKYILLYQNKKIIEDCALLVLKAIDSQIGLYDFLKKELKTYFPDIETGLLKKILIMLSFSSRIGVSLENSIKREGFLRIADCYAYPAKKVKSFLKHTVDYKPAISLKEVKENSKIVSTIKFHFFDNSAGFCDAKLTTTWDGYCNIKDFFLPLYHAKARIAYMLKEKVIILNYTKSFDYLSQFTINFIKSLHGGIKRVDFLNEKGQVLDKIECNLEKPTFLIGYYPKILGKGLTFLEKEKRFKKLNTFGGVVYHAPILTRFSQSKSKEAIILNNILIKTKEKYLPNWAVLTDRKANFSLLLKKYLFVWPYMEKVFLDDIKMIENSFSSQDQKKDFVQNIPDTLIFEKEEDYSKISDILFDLLKWQFEEIKFRGSVGTYAIGKDFCKISINNLSPETKRKINNTCLYLNNKRVFLV
ncbi:MAG: hypothetical protein WC412_07655, partial [Candidatus Omnitrophota bacterium]